MTPELEAEFTIYYRRKQATDSCELARLRLELVEIRNAIWPNEQGSAERVAHERAAYASAQRVLEITLSAHKDGTPTLDRELTELRAKREQEPTT